VSRANVGRQLFSTSDVSQNKAALLIHRVNAFYGLAWHAAPSRFDASRFHRTDIVVTCDDSAAARREIGFLVEDRRNLYY
jgi:hypothetical protein